MTLLAAFDVLRDVPEHEAFAVSDTELREVGESHVNIVVKRVLKRGRRIDDASTATKLHDLRKEMKRVRYLLELVEPYLHGSAQRLRKAAARLQDVLGEHQDACAAEVRMRAYLDASPPEGSSVQEAFALGRLAEAERLAARKARKRVAKAWRSFEEAAGSRY